MHDEYPDSEQFSYDLDQAKKTAGAVEEFYKYAFDRKVFTFRLSGKKRVGQFYRLMDVEHTYQLNHALLKTLKIEPLEQILGKIEKDLNKQLPEKFRDWTDSDRKFALSYLPSECNFDVSIFSFSAPERVALLFIMLSGCRPLEAEKIVAGKEGKDVHFESVMNPDDNRKYDSIRIDSEHTKTGVDYIWGMKSPAA